MLSDEQIERYSRQIILPQVGGKGQEKLLRARVLVSGSGPLQEEALFYLTAVGIGTIGVIADAPFSLFSVLAPNREDALSSVLQRLNPDCTIVPHGTRNTILPGGLEQLVRQY